MSPSAIVRCSCPFGHPTAVDDHGLGPNRGAKTELLPPRCAICGGSGETTRGRRRAARVGGAAFLAAASLALASVGTLVAAAVGWLPYAIAPVTGVGAVLCAASALALQAALERTAPDVTSPRR